MYSGSIHTTDKTHVCSLELVAFDWNFSPFVMN